MGNKFISLIINFCHFLASFFVPKKQPNKKIAQELFESKKVIALIPTYKPQETTLRLVNSLVGWHKNVDVIIVDDSTPINFKNRKSINILKNLKSMGKKNHRVTVLRTPQNKLKAGALNFGLEYVNKSNLNPSVIVTFDDDVTITKSTIFYMVQKLFSEPKIGAVCSLSLVKNKNTNILTRLQGLEYHGFNITKIADNGFLRGPLVMQGMLTAFRYKAIRQVKGFTPLHLIEDYDITARIKQAGWHTAIASNAIAWTDAPDALNDLWKQRVRWTYGGLGVMQDFWKSTQSVFQDLVGHAMFLSLFILVLASLLISKKENASPLLVEGLFFIAIVHFATAFLFNMYALHTYKQRDRLDVAIKILLLPELIYANILSLQLIGAYSFFVFNKTSSKIVKLIPKFVFVQTLGQQSFQKLGFSMAWGTRI